MEVEHNSCVVLFCVDNFFVIRVAEECKERTLNTEGRLDNVGNISLVCFGVKVCEILAGGVLVLCEVVALYSMLYFSMRACARFVMSASVYQL